MNDKGWFERRKRVLTKKGIQNKAPEHYRVAVKNGLEETLRVPMMKEDLKRTDESIIEDLKKIKNESGHFPTPTELYESGMTELYIAMDERGGVNKFRELLGDAKIKILLSHWTEEAVLADLKKIKNELGHFPTHAELIKMGRSDLNGAIHKYGGTNKFRELLGGETKFIHWTDEKILEKLIKIINKLGHFPTHPELYALGMGQISSAILVCGGTNKFRELLGEKIIKVRAGYWTEEQTINDIKQIIEDIGHFPTGVELLKLGRANLLSALLKHGGINRFRKMFGYHVIIKAPPQHWTDETIIEELKKMKDNLGHFPRIRELLALKQTSLINAIGKHGGVKRFKELLGEDTVINKYGSRWTDETILEALKKIKADLGHFPRSKELIALKRIDLSVAISRHGGFNKFRELFGEEAIFKRGWTDEIILTELNKIINKIGHFPKTRELRLMGQNGLINAMTKHGGSIRFREMVGWDAILKTKWTDVAILAELIKVIAKTGHFPRGTELIALKRKDILNAMNKHGGSKKFRRLLGEETQKTKRTAAQGMGLS